MKRCLCLLFVCVSFLASFAVLAADPPTRPGVCRCGPSCACGPNCACDRKPEGVIEANSPLANGVEVAMIQQPVEDRRPFAPPQTEALIEKRQVEGFFSGFMEFVGGALTFFAFFSWIKSSLWMIPAGLFAIAGAIVLHGAMTKPRG